MAYTGVTGRQWSARVRTTLLVQWSGVNLRLLTSGVVCLLHVRSLLGEGRVLRWPNFSHWNSFKQPTRSYTFGYTLGSIST